MSRQKIPRPSNYRAGNLARWDAEGWLIPEVISSNDVVVALAKAGLDRIPESHQEAWLGTELTDRQRLAAAQVLQSGRATSAVLAPIFDDSGGQARVILTRRSQKLRRHTGEISFPGGMVDAGERVVDAALREAKEEVGIDPSSVDVVGHLEAMPTLASGAWIVPFVGVLSPAALDGGKPRLSPNPEEVERVFDVALIDLVVPSVYREEIWEFPGFGEGPMNFFELDFDTVWGATARMLRNLLEVVLGS